MMTVTVVGVEEEEGFAMAIEMVIIGDMEEIITMGRHIVETGVQSGLSRAVVQGLIEELQETSQAIVEATFNQLPEGFPEALVSSIDGALKARLHLLN